jgi:hypothetical protein
MKILRKNIDQNIILNKEDIFKTDLGWQDNAQEMEKELLTNIINPVQNFETVRYIHKPYIGGTGILQTDILFKFWFISGNTYVQDYEPTGLSARENALMLKQTTESFFRLEFYKTPNGDSPNRSNRRLVFAKNLSLPLGEKYYYTTLNDYIFKPVFIGSNYRNKENMYLFWFQDDSALNEETLTGDTFYMTAKFFNAEDGSITDFTNKPFINGFDEPSYLSRIGTTSNPILFYQRGIPNPTQEVDEDNDMYYCVKIKRNDIEYGYVYDIGCSNCLFSGGFAVKQI